MCERDSQLEFSLLAARYHQNASESEGVTNWTNHFRNHSGAYSFFFPFEKLSESKREAGELPW